MQDTQEEILATLKDILKWIRAQASPAVKENLEAILMKSEYRRLYQALDGKKMQKELARASGISQPRISQLVSAWQRAGIVDQTLDGKYTHTFSLEEVGIEIESRKE